MDDKKEYRKISELRLNNKNPRGIKDEDFERLKHQIKKLGQYKPVVITSEGKVLGGNMRIRAYEELGIDDIWVSVVNPKDATEEMEYVLSDNDSAGYWEQQDLAELLSTLPDFDMHGFKIDVGEAIDLAQLMSRFAPDDMEPKEQKQEDVPDVLIEITTNKQTLYKIKSQLDKWEEQYGIEYNIS